MALLSSSPSLSITSPNYRYYPSRRLCLYPISATHVVTPHHIDKSSLLISETSEEDQLWAAACLRVRSFHEFKPSTFGIQDHKRYLAEREFEALKERIAGKRTGFNRVSCLNASLPLSQLLSLPDDDLFAQCKFSENGEDRVVVGSLDVNQCMSLPDEITGMKPEFGELFSGITDLYVHVAVNNEPAKQLYKKSGFIYENDEPAWQARFLDRPRRLLLWLGLPGNQNW
ncbi:PREDICTED: uncharacterized protein LOC105114918 isoform X2 [Populus euphratica]|uniref:Uncharacterized protein LOC105114918 isoform X2 n=1 Tax=Populus euphratica TaxID=75702 RepID=A0AAJ6TF36_POPEU|nr:PREDICTED: uncharacterized protein LOC105114918 isoform X2 [Populus euphratica]